MRCFQMKSVILGLALLGIGACAERSPDAPPHAPSGPEPAAVEFELVTSIPAAGASSVNFHLIGGVHLGPTKDQVYVLDQFRHTVRVFDFDGDLVREFGGQGEGPGEFGRGGLLRIAGDRLHVLDLELGRITWFDWDGEYLGSRAQAPWRPRPGVQQPRPPRPGAVMRHGHLLGTTQPGLDHFALVLVDENDDVIDTVFTYRGGGVYLRTRRRPERWTPLGGMPNAGVQGYWTAIGDSLVATVDLVHGIVTWHRVDRGSLSEIHRRDLGFAPRPVSLTESEVRAQVPETWNLAPGDILDVDIPQFEAELRARSVPLKSGDLWILRRFEDDRESGPVVFRWILVPIDESDPVLELETPPNFHFRSAVDDLLLGVHVEPETGVESVRVYRWRLRADGPG